jgi:hypothetical protein
MGSGNRWCDIDAAAGVVRVVGTGGSRTGMLDRSEGLRGCGSCGNAGVVAVGVDGNDRRITGTPVVPKAIAYVIGIGIAGIVGMHVVICAATSTEGKWIVIEGYGIRIAAAAGAAVGDVAVGLIVDDLCPRRECRRLCW